MQTAYWQACRKRRQAGQGDSLRHRESDDTDEQCNVLRDSATEAWLAKRYFEHVLAKKSETADILMMEISKDMAQKDAAGTQSMPEQGPYYRIYYSSTSSIHKAMHLLMSLKPFLLNFES